MKKNKVWTSYTKKIHVPVIKVKDRATGYVHIVGTNCHDSLEIVNGHLDYLNLQCCEGTELIDKGMPEKEGFEFVGEKIELSDAPIVEFIPLNEFILLMRRKQKELDEINCILEHLDENGKHF